MIHIDFLGLTYTSTDELIETLHYLVNQNAQYHEVKLEEKTYDKRFRELVKKLSQRNKVVVLADEYDKPIIEKKNIRDYKIEELP